MILEQHGYPPLVLSFESIDELDHVLFVYRRARALGLDRPVARSRAARPEAGLRHAARALALSYVDPYVDYTGPRHRVRGRGSADAAGRLRLAAVRAERVEGRSECCLDLPHRPIRSSDRRIDALRARYRAFREAHGRKPFEYYQGRERGRSCRGSFSET